MQTTIILLIVVLELRQVQLQSSTNPPSPPSGENMFKATLEKNYPPDFNFHNKTIFLKEQVKKLVECIEESIRNHPDRRLPHEETLLKSNESSPNGVDRFIFKYNGSRGYEESCLGDAYKRDFLRRLYDAGCMSYEDKIQYLDLFSCNVNEYLECRQTGVEPVRLFAEQATPIMQCLCPDYKKTQSYITDDWFGHYDKWRKTCVLKVGQPCVVTPKGPDKRFTWNDFDWDADNDGEREGIDVVDLRPVPKHYPCVTNSFCYMGNLDGFFLEEKYLNRCACIPHHFQTAGGECIKDAEDPRFPQVLLVAILMIIATVVFFAGVVVATDF